MNAVRQFIAQLTSRDIAVFAAVSIAICVWVISTICSAILKKRRIKIVQRTSTLLKNLCELNERYHFAQFVQSEYTLYAFLPSKPKFDRYKPVSKLDETILKDNKLLKAASAIEKNRRLHTAYLNELKNLHSEITKEQAKALRVSYTKYVEVEKLLFAERQLEPVLDSRVVCAAEYRSPKGRNRYQKADIVPIDEVPVRYEALRRQIAHQHSEEMRRKRARSQMTDKLRYDILQRDGFRCQLCGRTAQDGVKLHVDHIIPVAKGGKTTWDNLRTLCEDCNRGKSDRLEENLE